MNNSQTVTSVYVSAPPTVELCYPTPQQMSFLRAWFLAQSEDRNIPENQDRELHRESFVMHADLQR